MNKLGVYVGRGATVKHYVGLPENSLTTVFPNISASKILQAAAAAGLPSAAQVTPYDDDKL